MNMNNYLNELYEECVETFNNNFNEFAEIIDAKKQEIDEWKEQYHTIAASEGDDHLEEQSTEQEIYKIFHKEIIQFTSKKIGGDAAMKLAHYSMLDDLVYRLIEENFDSFCVFYGLE